MVQEEVLSLARKYAEAVRKVVEPEAVYLYGSQARGTATKDSDIDIAVVVDHLPQNYLDVVTELWRQTNPISLAIEPVLLSAAEDRSGFLRTVRRTGILL